MLALVKYEDYHSGDNFQYYDPLDPTNGFRPHFRFDEQKQPNCVTPENIEAVNFVLEMVSKGYVDPASSTYTTANVQTQWKAKKFGLGYDTGGLADNLGMRAVRVLHAR